MEREFKKKLDGYIAWSGGFGEDTCSLCMKAQNKPEIPVEQRKEIPFPCPIHGDPRNPPADVLLALWIYTKMPKEERHEGEKVYIQPRIDILTLEKALEMCEVEQSQHLHYLWLIDLIHESLNG